MKQSPRARPPALPRGTSPRRGRAGACLILALLLGYLALLLLPRDAAALRLAGLSLVWWYGGIAAPLAGVLGVVLLWRQRKDAGDHLGSSTA